MSEHTYKMIELAGVRRGRLGGYLIAVLIASSAMPSMATTFDGDQ